MVIVWVVAATAYLENKARLNPMLQLLNDVLHLGLVFQFKFQF
jgi:hypothetical protein